MGAEVIHSEAERQFYLGAVGICMWYAREPVPGAAPSPAFDFSSGQRGTFTVPEVPAVSVPERTGDYPRNVGAGREKIAQLQSLMSAARTVDTPGQPDAPVPVSESLAGESDVLEDAVSGPVEMPIAASPDVPRLYLKFWRGERATLLCQLSEDVSLSLQETLAWNILRSLGERSPLAAEALRWPLFNNLRVSVNSSQDLEGVLSGWLQPKGALIVLGLDGVKGLGTLKEVVSSRVDGAVINVPESLAAVSSDPAAKRKLWLAIRHLAPAR